MEDNKRIQVVMALGGVMVFIMIISIATGSSPIDSLFLLIGQTIMYVSMLCIFGAPVVLLVALITMAWNEIAQSKDPDEEKGLVGVASKLGVKSAPKSKKQKKQAKKPPKPPSKAPQQRRAAKPVASKAKQVK